MVRPCFLVIDPEHSGSISTRKLVIESAKLNVITAYSGAEAIETFKKYPAVDGVVCNFEVRDIPVGKLIGRLKEINPKVPVIAVGPEGSSRQPDYQVDSFDPKQLLEVLQQIRPDKMSQLTEHEHELREREDELRDKGQLL
jgi:DNA-binding NtrC family response regulator